MSKKVTLEQKFTRLFAEKLKGRDVTLEMDFLTKEEIVEFKKWIAIKKEEAEEKIWKEKRHERERASIKKC